MGEETNVQQQQQNVQQPEGNIVSHNVTGAQTQIKETNTADVDKILDEVAGGQQPQQTEPQQQQTDDGTTIQQEVQTVQNALNDAEKDLMAKGVDFAALEAEYQQTGGLSQDSYNKLANAGYAKAVVDSVLAGWEAKTTQLVNAVIAHAGGEESFKRMQQYIMTQDSALKDTYNRAIQNGDLGQIRLVMDGIKARMDKAYGTSNPTILAGTGGSAQTAVGYQTTAEMVKDMSDPRYQTDAAFTKEVYQKVKNSILF